MRRYVVAFLLLSLLAVSAHAAPINLGTASTFGLLAGSGVTNTGTSVINGDVGSSPTPAVTGFPPGIVLGTLYTTPNAVTAQAQSDLTIAYNAAAGAASTANLTGTDLGFFNAGNPLGPGVYTFSSSAGLTGNLTLDGHGDPNAQWIFQIGSALTTATNATVSFINGASPCNVFWQVGSSATIQTNNIFAGTIMALTSITLNGGTLNGRALARNGAVTIAAAEFVNIECPTAPCVTVAKIADRSVAAPGDIVTYTYSVANCGPAALTVNSVVDSQLGNLTADFVTANGGTSTLAPGAFTVFTETRMVLVTDPSPLTNVVTVGARSGGVNVSATAEASVLITTPGPCVTIEKTVNRMVAAVGDFVTYTFDVCNCGTTSLTVNSVIDSRLGNLTADFMAANGGTLTLAAGKCKSFNEVYLVLPTDTSPIANTATVSASGGGTTVTSTDQASVIIIAPVPSVTVTKKADRVSASVGDVITYTYMVCNTGAAPANVSSVLDSRLGSLRADFIAANGGSATLDVGACVTFAELYTVQPCDKSPLVNLVTVVACSGGVRVCDTDEVSVTIVPPVLKPGIYVEKEACTRTACIGDKVTYAVTVTNIGNVPLNGLTVCDSLVGQLCKFPDTLAVGGSIMRKYTYVVTSRTPDPLVNKVIAKAYWKTCANQVCDSDCWSIDILHPGICITECASKQTARIGDKLTFTITVKNVGDTKLTGIHIYDTIAGDICGLPTWLSPGGCFTRTFTYVIPATCKNTLKNDVRVIADVPGCTEPIEAKDCVLVSVQKR